MSKENVLVEDLEAEMLGGQQDLGLGDVPVKPSQMHGENSRPFRISSLAVIFQYSL
jgi:hypothetical protein